METDTTLTNQPQTKIVDLPIKNQQDALQVMVRFLAVAQKRGAFLIDESAKIYECLKAFEEQR